MWSSKIQGEWTQKRIAACKLGPVITHEEVKKERTEQSMGASNLTETHLEKIVLFYNYFINNNIDY